MVVFLSTPYTREPSKGFTSLRGKIHAGIIPNSVGKRQHNTSMAEITKPGEGRAPVRPPRRFLSHAEARRARISSAHITCVMFRYFPFFCISRYMLRLALALLQKLCSSPHPPFFSTWKLDSMSQRRRARSPPGRFHCRPARCGFTAIIALPARKINHL